MEMNYRIVALFGQTGEVKEQYFPTYDDADIISDYLIWALENGAKLSYIMQKRINGEIITVRQYGNFIEQWEKLNWNC